MSKKILVTGGCGYIGCVLVPMLLERGYEVRVLDKLYFGDTFLRSVTDDTVFGCSPRMRWDIIEIIPGDVRSLNPMALDGIDGVIHLGSLSNDPTAEFDPEATHNINYTGTINLANACKERGIERFIFASSCAVYGFHLEDQADENHAPFPQSAYAKSKLDVDIELQKMADDNFCPVSLRQATVFGFSPRMRWDIVVNAFVMHAFKSGRLDVWYGGEAWRPLVHVKDVAEAYIQCLEVESEKVRGEVFNLVYGNYRILDVAQRVGKALSEIGVNTYIDINRDQVDSRSYRISGNKITEHLNISPSVSIEEGTKEIADVLDQGKYRDFDHPIYYNVRWMQLLVEIEERLRKTGKVL